MAYGSTRSLVRAALGIALVFGGQQGFAAETPAANSTDPGDGLEEVTVTGSRIEHSGFQAPTPVSVLDASQVEDRGATNIANVINEIPAFTGSITPASTGLNSRQNGINAVDLRGLGTNRNLVLLNGRRGTPFDELGNVDLNAVPSLAIGRVEVVTGGASAAWGSDAISGVVNLIYDETLEGFKFNAQYGQSAQSDAEDTRLSGAWGTSLNGGAGHFLLAADYNKNEGVPEGKARGWQRRSPALVTNPDDTGRSDGRPAFLIRDNAVLFIGSPNGVTLPGVRGVDNQEFFPNGTAQTRQLGQVMDNFMLGGSGSRLGDRSAIFIPTERFNVLATFQHDIGDHTEAFVEASFAQSKSEGKLVDAFSFGDVLITPDNPYLPANIAALDQEFSLFRTFSEVPPITSESKNDNVRFVAGLKGDFGNSFRWNASGQYGRTKFSNVQPQNLLVGNLVLAADAVRDPVSGNIVCRANLNGANGAPGCAPINLFGSGSPSAAALGYVFGRGTSDTEIKQTVFMADVGGELLDLWAGPLLGTFGVEYRKEELDRVVNAPNENEEFLIVNAQPLNGEFNAKEGFVEFALPLLKSDQQALDLNAAARVTDYSTVGSVTTWKAGLVYSPIESLRFRGSISQDIRAPSIGETFVKTVLLFGNISNPFFIDPITQQPRNELIESPTVGNPDLKEETAKTTTFGVVYSGGGFRASVDWYHIDLTDTIGVLSAQSVATRCFEGETNLCDLITFNPNGTGSIDSISGKNINLGTFDLKGVDAELRYTQPVGNGDLSVGLIGSYLIHKEIAPSGGAVVDTAGEVGAASGFGTPDFKATLSVSYDIGDWGAFAQARYIGSGVYDATYGAEDLASSENDIGSVTYVDLSAHYDLNNLGYGQVTLFAGVDNAFDKDPPVVPLNFISNAATNGAIYDVIGRKYYVGARMKF
jgi:iron complex outermembrane recepter protein